MKQFEVIKESSSDQAVDYYIVNNETREVRVLRDCELLDMDVFDEMDFYEVCERI